MARRVKTFVNKLNNSEQAGFAHREHRSKKGRKIRNGQYNAIKLFKRRKEELKKKELQYI